MPREILSYYKKSLIKLISSVQELNREPENKFQLCKEIQLSLIDKIFYIEHKIRNLRNEQELAKKKLHIKQEPPLTKEQSEDLKTKINTLEEKISGYHELRKAFKSVGDAIAFTFMDKYSIKQFSQKEDVGFISGKTGFKLEMECFKVGFDHGFTAILHDLTNCLRHGDITYFKKGKPNITLECKSGKSNNKRGNRQINNINEIYKFLYSDEKEIDGNKVYRISLQNHSLSYSFIITNLIEASLGKEGIYQQVEDGLYYLVTNSPSFIGKGIHGGDITKVV